MQIQLQRCSELFDTDDLCVDCRQKIYEAQEEKKDRISDRPLNSRINERIDTEVSLIFEKKSSGLFNDSESARSMVAEENLLT